MTHFTDNQVNAYAASRQLVPGALLWSSGQPLSEEAFRSGAKGHAAVDFLRWQDIGLELTKGKGRIPPEEHGDHMVNPGQGISMFIKRMLPEGMVHLGSLGSARMKDLKEAYDPVIERHWWQFDPAGQPLPVGLQLVYDGVPPGHCTLTVDHPITVQAFLALVAQLKFTTAGSDYYGIARS